MIPDPAGPTSLPPRAGTPQDVGAPDSAGPVPPVPAIERPTPFHELGDFTTVDRRTAYLAGLAVPIGLLGALAAALLLGLIGLLTNLFYYGRISWSFVSPAGNSLGLVALGIPVLGGLIVGAMARFGSERIRGHGIPEALESILVHRSRMEPRVTLLKPVSAAVSIGSGGPFGAEGPIIMTGGSLGSVIGQLLHLSAAERKTLLVAGAAAGMAATFNAPVAAVLIAVELLLFEWRPRSLLPVGVAATTATLLRWPILGRSVLFPDVAQASLSTELILAAALVGLVAGVVATVLTRGVYLFEDLFRRLPVHWMWWPAIGGIAIGVGGLIDPRMLGVGYNTIGLVLAGGLGASAVLLLLAVKGSVWSASLGSGTSGGVLAPLLMMGAATGSLVGGVLPIATPAYWALIALGAILGGAMRVPFTGAVFALELTGNLGALFPLLVACLAAEGVTIFTLRRSILTEKIARRRVHAAREYAVDPLEVVPIRSVMHKDLVPIPAGGTVAEAVAAAPDRAGKHLAYLVVAPGGGLEGYVTQEGVATYLVNGGDPGRPLAALLEPLSPTLEPDQPTRVGAALLAELDRQSLPVRAGGSGAPVVGILSRESIFEARVVALEEEQERDRTLRISFPRLQLAPGFFAPKAPAQRRDPRGRRGEGPSLPRGPGDPVDRPPPGP